MVIHKEAYVFDWDQGNLQKNLKHQVTNSEAEEAFYDPHKKIFTDKIHSKGETRYRIIGITKNKRILFIVFTIRQEKIRIISARNINKKERYLYEKAT